MDGRVYYDDAPFDLSRGTLLRFWQGEFYYVRSSFVNVRGNTYQLYVCTALTYWLWLALWVIGGLVGLDAMRGAYFILRGHSLNAEFIRPIEKISETARHLNAQNMSERIDVEGTHSELRELALVINDMLDRMETAYDGQKQFVSDASHELRTPIAVIQGYANMLERWGKDDKDRPRQRPFVPLRRTARGTRRGHRRHKQGSRQYEGAGGKTAVPGAPR